MKNLLSIIIVIVGLFASTILNGQSLLGMVVDQEQTPLIGASLIWQGTTIGVTTDNEGYFTIDKIDETNMLVINYVGYQSDTLEITEEDTEILIILSLGLEMEEIEITAKQRDNFSSLVQTINIETIGSGELKKAACCNLSESFETNGTVNVAYSDAVTGVKEIEMLGLRGIYTRMMVENRPSMRGLGYPFGLEYIPGTWVSNISIIKGAGNVVNGNEGIAGTMNIELIKPFDAPERIYVNAYGNQYGRSELNVHLNHNVNKKWSIGTLLHGANFNNAVDHGADEGEGDGFIDMPMKQTLNGMLRAFYRGENLRGQFNVHALTYDISGGQVDYETSPSDHFGFELNTDRVEAFGKIGYIGFDNEFASLGWITNLSWHKNDGFFGLKDYDATQRSIYTNVIFQNILATTEHNYKLGASYALDEYDEIFNNVDYSLTESTVGGFVEYSYTKPIEPICKISKAAAEAAGEEYIRNNRGWAIVAGLRADYHNLYGFQFAPRVNAKYNFNEETIMRLSAGRGYRSARVLAENFSVLSSAKSINQLEPLEAEEAWNAGLNFTKNTTLATRDLSLSVDFYSTQFTNQIIVDRETDQYEIQFYNLKGRSFANSFLATATYDVSDFLEIKVAYKLNDVKITYDGDLLQAPLIAKHRGLVTFDIKFPDNTWRLHTTVQIVGPQRMPTLLGHENHTVAGHNSLTDYQRTGITPTYATVNAQLTKTINEKWELYAGGENLTNYRQHHPIIGASDPFDQDSGIPTFDASQIYAPIMGAIVYAGFRFKLK
jgi:outer membrane receptor protein involved in Fe transport